VVNISNERGQVLCGAYVTERIMPGVIYVDHGSRYDPIVPERSTGAERLIPSVLITPLSKNWYWYGLQRLPGSGRESRPRRVKTKISGNL
jgi:anaerobic selenocysteine-containing dehydrogenase